MAYSIRLPDGSLVNNIPDEVTPEAAKARILQIRPDLAPPPAVPVPPSKERTWGEAAKDIGADVVSGIGKLVQTPGQLYGLATGNFEKTGALGLGEDIAAYGEGMKSAGLKAREAARAAAIQEAEQRGESVAGIAAIKETIKDPALLASFFAENIPQLLLPAGAAKTAGSLAMRGAGAGLEGLAKEAAIKTAREAAIKSGERAAIGAAAAQQGADVGAQSYADIYKRLIDQGKTPEEAADTAINLARAAGASGAIISLLAQRLPGAKSIERYIAGGKEATGFTRGALKGAFGEGLSEMAEEGGGKFSQNLAMRQVDPTQSLTAGLGQTMGMAAIGGVGMGGVLGGLGAKGVERPTPSPVQETQPAPVQPALEGILSLGYSQKPFTPIGLPDGSVATTEAEYQQYLANKQQYEADRARDIATTSETARGGLPPEMAEFARASKQAQLEETFNQKQETPSPAPTAPPGYAELEQEKQRLLGGPKTQEVKDRLVEIKNQQIALVSADLKAKAEQKAQNQIDQSKASNTALANAEPQQIEMRGVNVEQPAGTVQKDLLGNPIAPKVQEEAAPQPEQRAELMQQYDTLAREMERLKAQYHVAPTEEMRTNLLKRGEQYQKSLDELRSKVKELDAQQGKPVTDKDQLKLAFPKTKEGETPQRTLESPKQEQPVTEPKIFKPTPLTPETVPTKVSPEVLGVLGIGPTAVLRKPDHGIHQLDIAKPVEAAQVKTILEAYKEGKSENIVKKVDAYLARPEFKGATNGEVSPTNANQTNVGATKPSVRVPNKRPAVPAGKPQPSEQGALGRTGTVAGEPAGGKGKSAPAVEGKAPKIRLPEALREKPATNAFGTPIKPSKTKYKLAENNIVSATKEAVENLARRISDGWVNAPTMHVVQSVTELPQHLQDQIKRDEVNPQGAYDTGTGEVYLIADNIREGDGAAVAIVVAHEMLGHHGLRSILGANYASVMQAIYDGNEAIRKLANEKISATVDKHTAVEEVLAEKAERGESVKQLKGVDKLIAMIRNFLQKIGVPFNRVTDNEVLKLIAHARDYVIEGGKAGEGKAPIGKAVYSTKGQEALESLRNNFNREVKPEAPGLVARTRAAVINATSDPAVTAGSAKKSFVKRMDKLETAIADSAAGLSNEIMRAIRSGTKSDQEKLGASLEISTAQRGGSVASAVLEYGKAVWDEAAHKWRVDKDKGSFKEVVQKIQGIAEKEGITYQEAELIAHTLFEARNVRNMRKRNEETQKKIIELTSKGKKAEATKLRSKLLTIHLTDAQIEEGLKLSETIPALNDVVDTWNAARKNALDVMVESGLHSKEDAEALFDNMDYVPFYREEQMEQGAGPKQYISNLQVIAKDRRLKGSSQAVNNILENQQKWINSAISRSVANRQGVALANAAVENGVGQWVDGPVRNKHVAKVWVNGEQKFVMLDDPLYMDAFNGLQAVAIPMFKWASGMAKLLRNSVVLHPLFAVSQVPQDAFAAMFSSGLPARYALTIPARAVKEFLMTIAGASKSHEELKRYGAVGVQDFQSVLSDMDSAIYKSDVAPKNILKRAGEMLHHIATASDSAVRQATYEASLAAGLSKAEAIEKAFNVANFRNRGTSKTLALAGQVIPFFHAYIAMQHVAFKTLTGKGISPTKRSEAFKNLIATTASTMVLGMLYAMLNGDDEDYLNKPTNIRDRLLMIPGTGGISIPLRMDIFSVPKIIAEHTYLLLTDKGSEDGYKFRQSMKNALVTSLTGPTPIPQIIKPVVEVAINHDFFQGREIISKADQSKETSRQFKDSTSELGKLLGSTGLIAPINVDHLMRGMFGSAGGLTMYLTNQILGSEVERPELSLQDAISTFPGMSSFVSKENETGLKSDFYELQKEVMTAANTYKDIQARSPEQLEAFLAKPGNIEKLSLASSINSMTTNLGNIRKQITRVTNDVNIPASQKRIILDELKNHETQMLKAINLKDLRERAKI